MADRLFSMWFEASQSLLELCGVPKTMLVGFPAIQEECQL